MTRGLCISRSTRTTSILLHVFVCVENRVPQMSDDPLCLEIVHYYVYVHLDIDPSYDISSPCAHCPSILDIVQHFQRVGWQRSFTDDFTLACVSLIKPLQSSLLHGLCHLGFRDVALPRAIRLPSFSEVAPTPTHDLFRPLNPPPVLIVSKYKKEIFNKKYTSCL